MLSVDPSLLVVDGWFVDGKKVDLPKSPVMVVVALLLLLLSLFQLSLSPLWRKRELLRGGTLSKVAISVGCWWMDGEVSLDDETRVRVALI